MGKYDGQNIESNKASAPQSEKGGVLHLDLKQGDVPPFAILPGDPARTLIIAEEWENVNEVAYNREYKTVTGIYKGLDIAAVSTGIGAPSSEICIHELHEIGVHTCLRVGTTGSISENFDCGDLIIPVACMRNDGSSDIYIDPSYPASADTWVVMALMQACENLGFKYGLGITYTTSSFYAGQGRPLFEDGNGFSPKQNDELLPFIMGAGLTNIEMEASAQFVIGKLHNMRMGAVLAVIANRITDEWGEKGSEKKASIAAAEAIHILDGWDKKGEMHLSLKMPK